MPVFVTQAEKCGKKCRYRPGSVPSEDPPRKRQQIATIIEWMQAAMRACEGLNLRAFIMTATFRAMRFRSYGIMLLVLVLVVGQLQRPAGVEVDPMLWARKLPK